jgi:hypothetical protein
LAKLNHLIPLAANKTICPEKGGRDREHLPSALKYLVSALGVILASQPIGVWDMSTM